MYIVLDYIKSAGGDVAGWAPESFQIPVICWSGTRVIAMSVSEPSRFEDLIKRVQVICGYRFDVYLRIYFNRSGVQPPSVLIKICPFEQAKAKNGGLKIITILFCFTPGIRFSLPLSLLFLSPEIVRMNGQRYHSSVPQIMVDGP